VIAQSSTFYIDAAACHRNNYNRFIEIFDVEIKMVLNSPMPGDIRVVVHLSGSKFVVDLKILSFTHFTRSIGSLYEKLRNSLIIFTWGHGEL